jgi:hypothetical protein
MVCSFYDNKRKELVFKTNIAIYIGLAYLEFFVIGKDVYILQMERNGQDHFFQ